ncbi:MAG: cytochrome P450 [Ignavibacteriota bacterium]
MSGGGQQIETEARDEVGRLKIRGDVLGRFSQVNLAQWRPQMQAEASRILQALPTDRTVDLFREFALPWGLSVAILATDADPADREKLGTLSTRVFAATGVEDSALRADAAQATAALDCIFRHIPLGEPTFVAVSQTMARLLASCWHALVTHPTEYAKLRARPELMPAGVEEMLRYSGIVRRIYRRAKAAVELGGVSIADGDLMALMLATANRDPAQFTEADRLDVTRPVASHFALGYGRNSCIGGNPVRMAIAVATTALVSTFAAVESVGSVEWRTGSGFHFPIGVEVTLIS